MLSCNLKLAQTLFTNKFHVSTVKVLIQSNPTFPSDRQTPTVFSDIIHVDMMM